MQDIRTQGMLLTDLRESKFFQYFEKIYNETLSSINIVKNENTKNSYFNRKFPQYLLYDILSIYPLTSGVLIQVFGMQYDDNNSLNSTLSIVQNHDHGTNPRTLTEHLVQNHMDTLKLVSKLIEDKPRKKIINRRDGKKKQTQSKEEQEEEQEEQEEQEAADVKQIRTEIYKQKTEKEGKKKCSKSRTILNTEEAYGEKDKTKTGQSLVSLHNKKVDLCTEVWLDKKKGNRKKIVYFKRSKYIAAPQTTASPDNSEPSEEIGKPWSGTVFSSEWEVEEVVLSGLKIDRNSFRSLLPKNCINDIIIDAFTSLLAAKHADIRLLNFSIHHVRTLIHPTFNDLTVLKWCQNVRANKYDA